jgi:hypothetical protein
MMPASQRLRTWRRREAAGTTAAPHWRRWESTAAFFDRTPARPPPLAALAGVARHLGAIGDHLLGVKQTLAAGHALHQQARVFVNQDAHVSFAFS